MVPSPQPSGVMPSALVVGISSTILGGPLVLEGCQQRFSLKRCQNSGISSQDLNIICYPVPRTELDQHNRHSVSVWLQNEINCTQHSRSENNRMTQEVERSVGQEPRHLGSNPSASPYLTPQGGSPLYFCWSTRLSLKRINCKILPTF